MAILNLMEDINMFGTPCVIKSLMNTILMKHRNKKVHIYEHLSKYR